jgi:6,7-dimethyl-8-ribityllumazine synthase
MTRDIDDSSENVLYDWSGREPSSTENAAPPWGTATEPVPEPTSVRAQAEEPDSPAEEPPAEEPEPPADEPPVELDEPLAEALPEPALEPDAPPEEESDEPEEELLVPAPEVTEADEDLEDAALASREHAAGELEIPDGYAILEGVADGARRTVAVVAARFNGDVTSLLLDRALEELDAAGVRKDAVTVMIVPGAFELPLAATALAKTRRYACVVALGCVIRGDTPHFDYVASEAASGLQLAALETGVPVSFGVLTLDRVEQADARIEKGAEAVRTALEMADVFSHLRAAAGR